MPGSTSSSSTSSSVPTSTRYCFPPVSMTAYMDPQDAGGGGTRPLRDGQGKTPGRAKREREVYDRTPNGSIERRGPRARTRRSRTIVEASSSWPRQSASAATTSSGRPVPSSGWNRVRVTTVTGGPSSIATSISNGRRSYSTLSSPRARLRGRVGAAKQVAGGRAEPVDRHVPRQNDPVVGRGNPAREGRAGQPDVLHLDETPPGRHVFGQGLAQPPGGPALGQDDVDELGVGGHPDGKRRPERDPRPRSRALGPGHRQPGIRDRREPAVGDLPLRLLRRGRGTRDHQAPALARLGRASRDARTRLVVCPTMDERERSPAGREPAPRKRHPMQRGRRRQRRRRPPGSPRSRHHRSSTRPAARPSPDSPRSRRASPSSSSRPWSSASCSGWLATPCAPSCSACCSSTCSSRRCAGWSGEACVERSRSCLSTSSRSSPSSRSSTSPSPPSSTSSSGSSRTSPP